MIGNANNPCPLNSKILAFSFMLVFPIVTLLPWKLAQADQPSVPKQHVYQPKALAYGPVSCPGRVTKMILGIASWRIQKIKDPQLRQVERGKQSLRLAALKGDGARARLLHETFVAQAKKGSGPWSKPDDRISALQLSLDDAALADQPGMIRLLIRYGAKPDFTSESVAVPAIVVAARCGNVNSMNALYSLGANLSTPVNPSDEGPTAARTAIEVAVKERQNRAILWLLGHGVDVCTSHASQRIARFMSHPTAKGAFDPQVVSKLKCGRN